MGGRGAGERMGSDGWVDDLVEKPGTPSQQPGDCCAAGLAQTVSNHTRHCGCPTDKRAELKSSDHAGPALPPFPGDWRQIGQRWP